MKKLLIILFSLAMNITAFACPACQKQQPKLFAGVTHGTGPDSNFDYVLVVATILMVLVTLYYSVKWLVHPRETNSDHIKRTVIN